MFTASAKPDGVVQNGLGVLFAIGWFTFLYLQNQEKVKTEQELAAEHSPAQSVVSDFKQELFDASHLHNEEVTVIVKAQRVYNASVVAKSPPHGLSR